MLHDLRYAIRSFISQPGFTIASVLTIAIGIAANTTIISAVNGALMRPLPYPQGDRLVMLWEIFPSAGLDTVPLSVADYLDYREQVHTLSSVALLRSATLALTGSGEPVMPRGMAVSPSLLPMLGARTALGGVFRPDEEEPGKSRVVMLSYGFWQSRLGSLRCSFWRCPVTIDTIPRS